jgi:hypothetical protein
MFDRGRDDVLAFAPECKEHALERKVGLAAAAREHDLIRAAAEQ